MCREGGVLGRVTERERETNGQGCHASFTRPRETASFENCPREIGLFVHSPLESF